ncbi:MAG TPA: PaaI family thioesterase [Solirubrobacteraceae bacterium]|nr:PaaI family thioesterase [Solirubrobacteraceae bacterium]
MVDGQQVIRSFLEQSPFALLAGLEVRELADDRAVLAMPFDERLVTGGRTVHGGAISTLIDTAATAAAWATEFEAMPTRWGTASLSVNFLRAADGQDLLAEAAVVRRGRSLSYCTVEARDAHGPVATGIVAYALA